MQFRPSIAQTLILVTLAAAFLGLGLWQLDRKAEKEDLFARFAEAPSMDLAQALSAGQPFTHVNALGRYDPNRHILLDNKIWQGRAGVHVLTPFGQESGPTLLVNRGWLPMPADRSRLPEVPTVGGLRELRGRLAPLPATGQRLGNPDVLTTDQWPQLMTYFDLPEIAAALGNDLEPWIVLLDAEDPNGFNGRQWSPATMGPEVHGGYAVQWLALLVTAMVIWVLLGVRRGEQLQRRQRVPETGRHSGETSR
jgi:surfeit locus 1 family protein